MTNFEKACENINTFQFFIYQIQRGVRPGCIPDINKCKSYLSECTLCERDWLNKEYDENDNFWTNIGYWDEIVKRTATVQSIRLKTQSMGIDISKGIEKAVNEITSSKEYSKLPTEKQIAYATDISKTLNIPLPKINTKKEYSNFITKYENTYRECLQDLQDDLESDYDYEMQLFDDWH